MDGWADPLQGFLYPEANDAFDDSRAGHRPVHRRPPEQALTVASMNATSNATSAMSTRIRTVDGLRRYAAVGVMLAGLITGCATPIAGAKRDLLAFLQAGDTTREAVLTRLGQPSGSFERETILTYRLGHDTKQGYYIISPRQLMPWDSVRYSLVLVFDANGVLRKHTLVDVQ